MGLSISWIVRKSALDRDQKTKAPLEIIKQLKEGGRVIVPVGKTVCFGTLILATKRKIEAEAGL